MIKIFAYKKWLSGSDDFTLDVQMKIEKGSFSTLFGKSGGGKTTLLRLIAGLIKPNKGLISINSDVWVDTQNGILLPPQRRKVGMVFQDYSLFPNMTVRENLIFALAKGQNLAVVDELIDIVELGDLQSRKPLTMSGGQQQRVALARAMVRRPELLLLDEPLSALDVEMRSKLQDFIMKIHTEFTLTTILVSHSKSEIIKMSDHVFVIDKGEIIERGTPFDIFGIKQIDREFRLYGKIISIENRDNVFYGRVLLEENIFDIVLTKKEADSYRVGDGVILTSSSDNLKIMRI